MYCVDALVNDYEQYSAPQIDDDQALASPAASPLQEPQEPVRSFSSGGATSAGQYCGNHASSRPRAAIKHETLSGERSGQRAKKGPGGSSGGAST